MERRREEVLAEVKRKKDEKKKVLEEQLKIIQAEKAQVDKDVQVRVRGMQQKNLISKHMHTYNIYLNFKLNGSLYFNPCGRHTY